MNRRHFLSLLLVPSTLALSGCTGGTRYASLVVTSDLNPNYLIALETSSAEIIDVFVEVERKPVGPDGSVVFTRLPPGEYRLSVFTPAGEGLMSTFPFGLATHGEATYHWDTGLTATPQP